MVVGKLHAEVSNSVCRVHHAIGCKTQLAAGARLSTDVSCCSLPSKASNPMAISRTLSAAASVF